jgi:hypothetical protein
MYFKIVREVLDEAIPRYAAARGTTTDAVDAEIATHIETTAHEHNNNPDPNIDYENYLCRLGYVFVHAGANGTLVERTFREFDRLRSLVTARAGGELSVCTIGGGPGTELLGLLAFLRARPTNPSRVNFTVLDRVQTWSETWRALARAAEAALKNEGQNVTLSREFQVMDISDPAAFEPYGALFGEQDVIIFNYILSENKVRLDVFKQTLSRLIAMAKPGTVFVFIDRIEYSGSKFVPETEAMIAASGLAEIERQNWGGAMSDSESELAEYIARFGKRRPRRWFRTFIGHRPTAFSIVAVKPAVTP